MLLNVKSTLPESKMEDEVESLLKDLKTPFNFVDDAISITNSEFSKKLPYAIK